MGRGSDAISSARCGNKPGVFLERPPSPPHLTQISKSSGRRGFARLFFPPHRAFFFFPHIFPSGVTGMLRATVAWWQYSLINGQLATSSHNYSFQIIKLSTLNVKRELSDSSNRLGVLSEKILFPLPSPPTGSKVNHS